MLAVAVATRSDETSDILRIMQLSQVMIFPNEHEKRVDEFPKLVTVER